MSKKSLILVVSLVLALTMGLGGTLAFFTDRDSETNIFTVGNVDIDLTEDFEQGAELVPGKEIEKKPVITNVGNNDAYVWMTVAVPAGLESSDASDNIVHWNWMAVTDKNYMNAKSQADVDAKIAEGKLPEGTTIEQIRAGQNWTVEGTIPQGQETIDGVTYNVYLMKYNDVLQPGETTLASLHNVYLDPHVDIDPEGNLAWVENGVATDLGYNLNTMGNPKIYVAAYGIQSEGFADVEEAYEAYGIQWGENGGVKYNLEQKIVPVTDVRPAGYVPAPDEGVIDNMIITDGSNDKTNLRAIYNGEGGAANYLTEDLTIKNSYFDGTYAMNLYAVKDTGVELTVEDTTLAGWTSYTGFEKATFVDCTFKANTNPEIYNVIRPYSESVFEGCEFDGTELWLDQLAGAKITLKNCTYKGEKITDASVFTIAYGDASSIVIE